MCFVSLVFTLVLSFPPFSSALLFSLSSSVSSSFHFLIHLFLTSLHKTAADGATYLFSFPLQFAVTGAATTQICADITSVMENAAARSAFPRLLPISDCITQSEGSSSHTDKNWCTIRGPRQMSWITMQAQVD